jgi:hypothetical protein
MRRASAFGWAALLALTGCLHVPAALDPATCDPASFPAGQRAHAQRAEVTLCGTVVRVRPAHRSRSGWHRSFEVDVGGGDDIDIDANLDVMGDFPVRAGERAVVRGEYYEDSDGREGVHWTHRTDRGSHPAGYVILDGVLHR